MNYIIQKNFTDELGTNGLNKNLKIGTSVSIDDLIQAEFTNHYKPKWYLCRGVGTDISFNLTIDKKTLQIDSIDVLNDTYLQPFDYQHLLMNGKQTSLAKSVFDKVDELMNELQVAGIIEGYQRGMYV